MLEAVFTYWEASDDTAKAMIAVGLFATFALTAAVFVGAWFFSEPDDSFESEMRDIAAANVRPLKEAA